MIKISEICPFCSSADDQEALYVVNGCEVTRCRACGAGHAQARDFVAKEYYGEAYFKGGHDDGYSDYKESEAVLRAEFGRIVRQLASLVPPGGRVLEMGCAYGYFLKEAGRYFHTVGIEISEAAVAACHDAGLTNVICGTLETVEPTSLGTFDAIVMLDVVEHLEYPAVDLRKLADLLRPNGLLLLSTGDFSSHLARLTGSHWRLMTPPQHLWYLTPKALSELAPKCGLEVVSIRHNWKFVPLGLALFQVERMLGLTRLGVPRILNKFGVPINLFDAMHVIFKRRGDRGSRAKIAEPAK